MNKMLSFAAGALLVFCAAVAMAANAPQNKMAKEAMDETGRAVAEYQTLLQDIARCTSTGAFYSPKHPDADANGCYRPPTCSSGQKLNFDGVRFVCHADLQG